MAEIVASILVESAEQARVDATRAAMAGADMIELRLDRWQSIEVRLEALIDQISLPVLVSCRTPDDGGSFAGTLAERRALFERALDAGARGLDLELWESWAPRADCLVVRSHHDFKRVPDDLEGLRGRLLDAGDIAKIACSTPDLADAAPLFELLASGDREREPTVAFGIGERATASRLLACAFGAPWIYASVAPGAETAPGQLPVDLCAGLYRARELGSGVYLAGVIGDPARHSLGPWIHNRVLRTAGLDAVYLPLETARPVELLAALPRRRMLGLSVTAPHKQLLARRCHQLSDEASSTEAVNTITFDAHGVLCGHNTDVAGVRDAFAGVGLECAAAGERAVVLGGGGAARAAAIALHRLGFEVTIMARSLEQVREFGARHGFTVAALRAATLESFAPRAVVHATPVGSLGGPAGRLLPDWTPAPGCFVLDMVYRPQATQLLRDAAAAGAVPVSGISMFLAQAAEQASLFAGRRPESAELEAYLAGALRD